jgi:hypothetical protein
LGRFFGTSKKSRSQPTRNEPFTRQKKTGRLYDTADFPSNAPIRFFPRNLLRINMIGTKNGLNESCQNRVTYNNMLFKKPKNGAFLASGDNVIKMGSKKCRDEAGECGAEEWKKEFGQSFPCSTFLCQCLFSRPAPEFKLKEMAW